jgi:nucleotide-binding universal stress UspA family protein
MGAEDAMKGTGTFSPETTAPVLLATDGSVQAEQAARAAIELADATGSELHLVHVGVVPNFLGNGPGTMGYDGMLYEQIEREAREALRKLTWRTRVAGGTVVATHLRLGGVAEEIISLAEGIGAGVIVMGSRGRGRLRRFLLGSVSGTVVRRALCSVLVVRPKRGLQRRPRLLRRSSTVHSETPE